MPDKHLSTQFDSELGTISAHVLQMGGLVEAQVAQALYALMHSSAETAAQVLQLEARVNQMEVQIDRELSSVIARRQPTARDLRLLIAVSKSTGNLERVGDEASRIARTVQRLASQGGTGRLAPIVEDIAFEADLAMGSMRRALDAFARLDTAQALQVIKRDREIDDAFDSLMRKLATYMIEDPRTISTGIDLTFVAKAIERVGDHAKSLAEQIIYVVRGDDVRHARADQLDSLAG